jgi:hypothetical protein
VAPFLSLNYSQGFLYAVFADRSTTTLDIITLPEEPRLPSDPPAPEVVDKIDIAPPLSPSFGEHVLSVYGGVAAILYLDRKTDVKNVLKLATRSTEEKQWNLDVLEPPGDPLLLYPDKTGGFSAGWSAGGLSYRAAHTQISTFFPPAAFRLQGHACLDGAGGFTAFDSLSAHLFALRWTGAGFSSEIVPEGTSVQASLRTSTGLLRVVSWDAKARRLMLHQQSVPGGVFSSATITMCDGTDTVALLPGQSDANFIVVFNEIRPLGARKISSQLSLIAPGTLLGAYGTRYRKAVLCSGESRINGFAAVRTVDAVYVLVSQGDLKLIRIPLKS